MSVITSGNMSYVLTEAVSAVAINAFMQEPLVYPMLFNQAPTPKSDSVTKASVSGLGTFQTKGATAAASRDTPVQQFKKEWVHAEYALVVEIERAYVDDENFGHVASLGAELGRAGSRTYEEKAATVFSDAFSGSTVTCEDGLSLCNDAHVNADSGNSQDNSGTTALSYDGVATTRRLMRDFTDYRGQRISTSPSLLLVPNELEETAWQIVNAQGKPGSANNDINMFSSYSLIVWDRLTDANAWFLIDPTAMMMHNFFHFRTALEFFGDRDWDTMVSAIGGYTRFSYGPMDWRWIYGNNPS